MKKFGRWYWPILVVAVLISLTATVGGTWAVAQAQSTTGNPEITWEEWLTLTPEEQDTLWASLSVEQQTQLWGLALRQTISDEVEFALQQGIDIRAADLELLYKDAGSVSLEVQKLRDENAALVTERNALNWEVQQLRSEIGSLQVSSSAVVDAAVAIQAVKAELEALRLSLAADVSNSTQTTSDLMLAGTTISSETGSLSTSSADSLDAAITMRQAIIELEQVTSGLAPASSGGTDDEFWSRACVEVVEDLWNVPGMNFSGAANAWPYFGC